MCCKTGTCIHCDPGIEAFYQEKVKEAKRASAAMKLVGIECHYENLLDAKDIWYEYCDLRATEQVENSLDEDLPDEIYNLTNSWT